MRNSHNITLRTTTLLPTTKPQGHYLGAGRFIAWLLALGFLCLMYGPNTLFFHL